MPERFTHCSYIPMCIVKWPTLPISDRNTISAHMQAMQPGDSQATRHCRTVELLFKWLLEVWARRTKVGPLSLNYVLDLPTSTLKIKGRSINRADNT